ncbi:MAG: hypothetical protein SF028_14880 [Candidatus Sumerlaeia bacterium]|nr:hypothetical protein [Candidatus Sumerlaeia bacterium]
MAAALLIIGASTAGAAIPTYYTFSEDTGATYTEITGGTLHGTGTGVDDNNYTAVAIGFTFNYDGANYTALNINSNGFVNFGTAPATNTYTPISSSAAGTQNIIAPMGNDLQCNTSGTVRSELTGVAPNRRFVIQYKDTRPWNTTGSANFQIILEETSNNIYFHYGPTTYSGAADTTEVGIKGATNADYLNRTGAAWTASSAGATNSATLPYTTAVLPDANRRFIWTYAVPSGPPNAAAAPSPANAATSVAITTNLGWAPGTGGFPTGYRLSFGTDGGGVTTPTNIVNNSDLGLVTTYDPASNLAYSTTYYWQITPYNLDGQPASPPIWSFTTAADPAISTFPYTYDFSAYTSSFQGTPPTGWFEADGQIGAPTTFLTAPTTADAAGWQADDFLNVTSPLNRSARINLFGTALNGEWIISPVFDLNAAVDYRMRFRAGLTPFSGSTATTIGTGATVNVVMSTDGGLTWSSANILDTFDNTTPVSNLGQTEIYNLAPGSDRVQFAFYARKASGTGDVNFYVDDFTVELLPTDPFPATTPSPANAATNVLRTANLTWAADPLGAAPTGYRLYFGTDGAGVTPPTNIANNSDLGLVTTYDPPGNMAYSTTYYWQIVPYDADGSATGAPIWSFTTEASPVIDTFPHTQNFASYLPAFWLEGQGNLGTPTTFSPALAAADNSSWGADGMGNVGSTGAARINLFGTTANEWLVTPQIDLGTTNDYRAKFDLSLTVFNGTGSATLGADDIFAVVISTDGGTTWNAANTLRQFTSADTIANGAGQLVTVDLSAYTGLVRLGFYAFSNALNADNDLFIDNFIIEEIPPVAPGAPVLSAPANNRTRTSLQPTFTWNAGSGGAVTNYYISLGTDGAGATTPTNVLSLADQGTATSYAHMTNLAVDTVYYWQVRATNGVGSADSPIRMFITKVGEPGPYPFEEGFDAMVEVPPVDWLLAEGALTGSVSFTRGPNSSTTITSWDQGGMNGGGVTFAGTDAMRHFSFPFNPGVQARREWLISQIIAVPASRSADTRIEFDLASGNDFGAGPGTINSTGSFSVLYSPDGSTWSSANILRTWTSADSIPGTPTTIKIPFPVSGNVRVAFYADSGVSDGDGDGITYYIDNFNVLDTPSSVEDWTLMGN